MRSQKWIVTAIGAAIGAASAAMAQTPWTAGPGGQVGANGVGSFFNWANGQNQTNLFGSPILQGGSQFVFIPNAYIASASNGSQETKSDTFSVDLHAFAGYKFTEIKIQVLGDYSVSPPGSVNVNGVMNLNEIAPAPTPHRNFSDPLPPINFTSGSGQWGTNVLRDLESIEFGVPFTDIHISFENNIVAISGPGGTAEIAKTAVGFPIAVTIIPEPGVVALLGLAGLVATRRRR